VNACTSYNALLGRSTLKKLGDIMSTPHLAMKFPTEHGDITTIYVDQKVARECYVAGLKMVQELRMPTRREESRNMVTMVDLDPKMNDEEKMKSREVTTYIQLGENEK